MTTPDNDRETVLSDAAGGHLVMLFDGVCDLCRGWVTSAITRDPRAIVRFAAIQSPCGRDFLRRRGFPTDRFETFSLIDGSRVFDRSTGFLRLVRYLRWPWPLLRCLAVAPRPLRDWLYDRVAGNRYRLFGRRDSCLMPTPALHKAIPAVDVARRRQADPRTPPALPPGFVRRQCNSDHYDGPASRSAPRGW